MLVAGLHLEYSIYTIELQVVGYLLRMDLGTQAVVY